MTPPSACCPPKPSTPLATDPDENTMPLLHLQPMDRMPMAQLGLPAGTPGMRLWNACSHKPGVKPFGIIRYGLTVTFGPVDVTSISRPKVAPAPGYFVASM